MRRYQKWVAALGLIAASPGITLAAGPRSPGQTASNPAVQFASAEMPQKPAAAGQKAPNQNQVLADNIAQALRKAKLAGYDINVACQNGVAVLDGMVGTPQQKAAVYQAVTQVKGVVRVDMTHLTVKQQAGGRQPSGVQQANAMQNAAAPNRKNRPASGVRTAGMFQPGEPVQVPPSDAPAARPAGVVAPPSPPPGIAPRPIAPPPSYMPPAAAMPYPTGAQPSAVYDQPNYPNYAWPGYAQHPNYAAVTYPKQYSASAWPYIGPFYPYPQVPLGWRQAQLEWDDGYWNLNFRPRTDRWWWFMDYRNW